MRLIKSLFVAIIATIMTATAGSAITHLFNEAESANTLSTMVNALFANTAYAEEQETNSDTPLDANHTFTTSLNTYTPSSSVIDETDLPTPLNNSSQSPEQEDQGSSAYVDILLDLVPLSGQDVDYEKVLVLRDEDIKILIEGKGKTIWDIATDQEKINLLEDLYYAVYPARIIELLEQNIINQEIADLLIMQANQDISRHKNISIDLMIENMLNHE